MKQNTWMKYHLQSYYKNVVAANAGTNYMYDIIEVALPHPIKPQTPTEKKNGKIGKTYLYTIKTKDPEDGQFYYMWD